MHFQNYRGNRDVGKIKTICEYLKPKGFVPKLHIMNNKTSNIIEYVFQK